MRVQWEWLLCPLSEEKKVWAESVRGAVGVRCPDLGGKRRPLLGGISSTVVSIRSLILSASRRVRYERFHCSYSWNTLSIGVAHMQDGQLTISSIYKHRLILL